MPTKSCVRHARRRKARWGLCTVVPWLFLWACASSGAMSYVGRTAQPDGRLTLAAAGPHDLQWENNDIAIQGKYTFAPDHLEINGQVRLQSRLANFNILDYLWVDLYFLDGEGVILDGQRLWNAGRRNTEFFTRWNFARGYAPPAGTRAITFGYTGRVSDGGGYSDWGGGDGIDFNFWRRP